MAYAAVKTLLHSMTNGSERDLQNVVFFLAFIHGTSLVP